MENETYRNAADSGQLLVETDVYGHVGEALYTVSAGPGPRGCPSYGRTTDRDQGCTLRTRSGTTCTPLIKLECILSARGNSACGTASSVFGSRWKGLGLTPIGHSENWCPEAVQRGR